ncbi:MAG TPA: hypothetical protein VF334_13055 [Polyangia bacterium]
MRRLVAFAVLLAPPAAAAATLAGGALGPLAAALDDAAAHAEPLAEHAATVSPAALTTPIDDEAGAFAAVVAADQALTHVVREQPAALPRGADTAVLTALDQAHAALSTYALARADGDRETMRSAARDAVEAIGRADALVEEARPYPLVHSR